MRKLLFVILILSGYLSEGQPISSIKDSVLIDSSTNFYLKAPQGLKVIVTLLTCSGCMIRGYEAMLLISNKPAQECLFDLKGRPLLRGWLKKARVLTIEEIR
jgi:hypothetical protein